MSHSKTKYEINGQLEHLFHKKDMEVDDLMRFYNQDHHEVEDEISDYCETLPGDLTKEFFKEEDYFLAYKEAQTDFQSEGSASLNSMQSLRASAEELERNEKETTKN